MSIGKVTDVTE